MNEVYVLTAIRLLLYVWCTVVAVASVAVHMRTDWRKTLFGRHLMYYMGTLALVFTAGLAGILFREYLAFQIIWTIIFSALPPVMTQRLLLQLRAQRQPPDDLDRPDPPDQPDAVTTTH